MSKELTDPADINAMVDPTGALARAGLYNPLPVLPGSPGSAPKWTIQARAVLAKATERADVEHDDCK